MLTEFNETGKRIRYMREKRKMTQTELAHRMGLQQATVHKWENGLIKSIKYYHIDRLAEVLNCSQAYLLGIEDEEGEQQTVQSMTPQEWNVIFAMRRNTQLRQAVYSIVEALEPKANKRVV